MSLPSPRWSLQRPWLCLPLVLLLVPPVCAQPGPNPLTLAELQALAALPLASQRDSVQRIQLTNWFLANCQAYMDSVRTTCLGRSALVNLGPEAWRQQGPLLQGLLQAPFGTGTYHIIFTAAAAAPGTTDRWWQFPLNPTALNIQADDTCWEEMNHALLGQNRPFTAAIDMGQYGQYLNFRSPNQQEEQEHVLIDCAANTATWVVALGNFERVVRTTNQKLAKYRGVRMTLAMEHQYWREAADMWDAIYNQAVVRPTGVRRVDFLTGAMRAQYQALSDARLPTIDQVVAFYMGGGVTDDENQQRNRGNPIYVPEWVMTRPLPARLVQIRSAPNDPTPQLLPADPAKGLPERLRFSFEARAVDTYRARGTGAPVDGPVYRGKLYVHVRLPFDLEKEVAFEVTVNGKLQPEVKDSQGRRAVEVDLAKAYQQVLNLRDPVSIVTSLMGLATPLPVQVVFRRDNPSALQGQKRYELVVGYRDEPSPYFGPPVYAPCEAIFNVDFTGSGTHATTGVTPAGGGPAWVLVKQWRSPGGPPVDTTTTRNAGGQYGNVKETVRYGFNGLQFNASYIRDAERGTLVVPTHQEKHLTLAYEVGAPPGRIPVGAPFSAVLGCTITDRRVPDGSYVSAPFPMVNNVIRAMYCQADGTTPGTNTLMTSGFKQLTPQKAQYSWLGPPPNPALPGLLVSVGGYSSATLQAVDNWLYEYRQAAQAPPLGKVQRAPDPPVVEDDRIDNEPPEDEEDDGEEPPPDPPLGNWRWYTHPSGAWRIRLLRKWSEPRLIEDGAWDELMAPGKTWQLHVQRQPTAVSGPANEALSRALAGERGESPVYLDLRGAPAAHQYLTSGGARTWSLWLVYNQKLYHLRSRAGANVASQPLHQLALETMQTVEYLKGATTTTTSDSDAAPLIGAFGSTDVFDTTGQLTKDEVALVRHRLNMLVLQHGLHLAVVFTGELTVEQASVRAGEYRQQLIRRGVLPLDSGLLLYAGSARGFSRDASYENRIPLSMVREAWQETNDVTNPAEHVAAQLNRIREKLPSGIR